MATPRKYTVKFRPSTLSRATGFWTTSFLVFGDTTPSEEFEATSPAALRPLLEARALELMASGTIVEEFDGLALAVTLADGGRKPAGYDREWSGLGARNIVPCPELAAERGAVA